MWSPGYAAVTNADGCANGRLAQPSGLVWPPVPGLGVSAAAGPPLPASWIAALREFQISRAKRPFSGAMAVGMARLGGFDPEIPAQNGTRHAYCPISVARGQIIQLVTAHANGRLRRCPKAING
jgi:hypothetical protein